MLQNDFGRCTNENTHYDSKKHAYLKTCQTSYVTKKFLKFYFNPSRWDRTPHYTALRCQVHVFL